MKLLIDLGNTSLKWISYRASQSFTSNHFIHKNQNLSQLLTQYWQQMEVPNQIYLANVSSSKNTKLIKEWVKENWNKSVTVVHSESNFLRVKNAYAQPESLGVDRWLALIAAYHQFETDVCIFDIGTAITADVIDNQGNHLGGLIFPGLTQMKEKLLAVTQQTQSQPFDLESLDTLLTTNTHDAINNGVWFGVKSFILNFVAEATSKLNTAAIVVITGGDGKILHSLLPSHYLYDGNLVLKGLALIAENNNA